MGTCTLICDIPAKLSNMRISLAIVTALTAGIGLAPTAAAWPEPLTPLQEQFIKDAKNKGVQGTDDQVFNMGLHACSLILSKTDKAIVVSTLMISENIPKPQALAIINTAEDLNLCYNVGRKRGGRY